MEMNVEETKMMVIIIIIIIIIIISGQPSPMQSMRDQK